VKVLAARRKAKASAVKALVARKTTKVAAAAPYNRISVEA
jgi:hypothetical protein